MIPAFIIGIVLSIFTVGAFAESSAISGTTYFSTYGHNYKAYSILSITSVRAAAATDIETTGSKVQAGYLGGRARLYSDETGYMLESTGWEYNDATCLGIQISTGCRWGKKVSPLGC